MAKTKTTKFTKTDNKNLIPILSIIAGIIIVAWPQIIGYAIGLYLIITGILKLAGK